jgi:DNA repair protein RecN (Recombination protein N)
MLARLLIQNYALIENLDIRFSLGLNIITGETGAGKSILLGALGLILGQRADTQVLLNKEKKCIIEGEFNIEEYNLKNYFEIHNLDYESTTIIRREISPEGKSRTFLNDTPVTLNILKDLSSNLVDIHSQHENLSINNPAFQLAYLDAFAKNSGMLKEYKELYNSHSKLKEALANKIAENDQMKKDLDYFQFQFNELNEANLLENEQTELELKLESLSNSETIKSGLERINYLLNEGENALVFESSEIVKILSTLAKYNPKFKELHERINSVVIELKDISNEVDELKDETSFNPAQIEQINERLNHIYHLEQKHRLNTMADLLILQESLRIKIEGITSIEDDIIELTKELAKVETKLISLANKISESRVKVIPQIEKKVKELLNEVALNNAVLKIHHEALSNQFSSTGIDKVRFLFSANKGVEYQEIQKVASGGELSRLTLCLKAIITQLMSLPTIVFDEIDSGVSGEVANKVGNVMQTISKRHQVITITHLPQIASKGESHFYVFKEVKNDKTYTRIKRLNEDERIMEIAKMLSGEKPTNIALENAKELLNV